MNAKQFQDDIMKIGTSGLEPTIIYAVIFHAQILIQIPSDIFWTFDGSYSQDKRSRMKPNWNRLDTWTSAKCQA